MQENIGRATRATAVMAVFLAVLMLGLPSFNLGNQQMSVSPVDNAAAAAGDRILTVGWPEFTTSIATLNPLQYTMASEMMTIWTCYSFLFTRDINGKMMGDLVTSYTVSPDGKTWNFKLVSTARFYDKNAPSDVHPLTGADVIYTFWLVQNTTLNNLNSYFPKINGVPMIMNMWTAPGNVNDLYIQLSSVYAPFLSSLTSIPILPQYVWSTQNWNWDNFRTRAPIYAPIIGSGPFYYMLDGMPSTGVVELGRSPTWFATEAYGWQLHINKLTIKTELSADTNLIDYQSGAVDIMELVSPSQYTGGSISGVKFAQSTGFVYEYNLNQMTDALRVVLGGAWTRASNNQLLLDPVVKKAMAMAVDKPGFVSGVLDGLGSVADSLVPDIHPAHYTYPTPVAYNPAQARQDLWDAGWRYDTSGNPISATSTVYPVCKVGGTDPLRFRFWTMDSSPEWDIGGRLMATWAALAGVDLWYDYKAQNSAFMNGVWANGDYDTWLWDWMFSPTSEVSTDVMQVLTTEAIGTWSDVYWSNKTYDDTYYASLLEIDPVARKVLTDNLQKMAYENMGCQLVAYRKELYAAGNLGPDHWELASYGNWETHYTLMPDQLYPWLYMQLEPADNHAPTMTGFTTDYSTTTTTNTPMSGSAVDDHGGVEYRWFYGDGSKTAWLSNPSVTHVYAKDGYYTAYLAARELTGTDGFVTVRAANVTVIDVTNTAPHNVDFTLSPSDPDSGTQVSLNATSIDDNPLDVVSYKWNFGDGSTTQGTNVVHQFAKGDPSYTVTVYADDGHLGLAPRPVAASHLISVSPNSPPTCSVPDVSGVPRTVSKIFLITSADVNVRDQMRYTWDWGDGSTLEVTSVKNAAHAYKLVGTYTLTVYADDQTGLPGHNVSDSGLIQVVPPSPDIVPVITQFVKNIASPVTGQKVMFTGTATDANGDICTMRFDFGDGVNLTAVQTAPNTTVFVNHTYSVGGPKTAYLYAFDGTLTATSSMSFVLGTTFTLNLVTGWNFVSVPRVGFGYKASTLGLTAGDTVSTWNPVTKVYKSHIVGVPVNDFNILPGTGYWINVPSGTRTLTLQGSIPLTTQTINISVPTGGGWAMIGFNSLKTTMKAADVAAMYNIAGNITTVARYNPATKSYTSWLSVIPAVNNFALAPGQAYWILVGASGVLAYEPQ
jgi:ABC-type oligopeptide transport system substrate-binding subunit